MSILAQLLEFENTYPVCDFKFQFDDMLMWPFIRSLLFSKAQVDTLNLPTLPRPAKLSTKNFIKYLHAIVKYSPLNLKKRQHDILILGWHLNLLFDDKEKWFNYVHDYFYAEYPEKTVVFETIYQRRANLPRSCEDLYFFDLLNILTSIQTKINPFKKVDPLDQKTIHRFIDLLKLHFPFKLQLADFQQCEQQLLATSLRLPILYGHCNSILDKLEPKIILFNCLCYGMNCHIAKWAKDRGIVTAEFQHGLIASEQVVYNYAETVKNHSGYARYLPDYLLTYGAFANENTRGSYKCVALGSPNLDSKIKEYSGKQPEHSEKKLLLLILTPVERYSDFIQDLACRLENDKFTIVIRPHPNDTVSPNFLSKIDGMNNIRIDSSKDPYRQVWLSDYILGTDSALLFEAAALNKTIFILEEAGSRLFVPKDFGIWFKSVDNLCVMLHDTKVLKRETAGFYWADNPIQRYRNFIDDILNNSAGINKMGNNNDMKWFKNILRFLYLNIDQMLIYCMRPVLAFRLLQQSKKNDVNLNLGSGPQKVPGFIGLDLYRGADVRWDLSHGKLPLRDGSCDAVVCNSALNYFRHPRAQQIISESWRVLKVGGIARFGVQDLESIARRYVEKDVKFFFQKLADGRERFEGATIGDKFVAWFYGYRAGGSYCNYFYDYESLALLFKNAGFSVIERKQYLESRLSNIELIDNRPDQMFFLEAIK